MTKFYQKMDQKIAYLVAVSGGSDSMFLLDNLYQNGFNIFVVHVNYQKRCDSDQDTELVINYCQRNQIKYAILKVDETQYTKENFQAQARQIRYDFFLKISTQEKITHLIVAHHFNDLLETYLLQKQRNNIVNYYGLQAKSMMQHLIVMRPMLKIAKDEILNYLLTNQIAFQNDSTNESDIYQRNVIRKQIAQLKPAAIIRLVQEITQANQLLKVEQQKIRNLLVNLKTNDKINYKSFLKLESDLQKKIMYQYLLMIDQNLVIKNYVKRILDIIGKSKKPNLAIKLNQHWVFVKEYDFISIKKQFIKQQYCYVVDKLQEFETSNLKLVLNNNIKESQGLFVSTSDFPIYIKNNNFTEKIATNTGTKRINRLFIDNKIPFAQRLNWPVIYNCQHQIIAIPMLAVAKQYLKDKNNWFMIK